MMKKTTFLKAAAAFATGLLLFACEKPPKEITLSVSDKSVSFETAGGDKTVTVTCNDSWTVNSTADWLTVSPKSGTDNGSIKITATANDSFDVRSADITVTAGDKSQAIKVNQLSKTPSLLIDPTATEVGHAGGEIELKITSNAPWDIHIPVDGPAATWATPDKESGEGSATVKITVQPNLEREVRSITLAVTEKIGNTHQDLVITQEMAPLSRRSDSLALVAIYNAADGANWKEERRWDLSKPIDTWDGVKVTDGRVSSLAITAKDVMPTPWTLPQAIGDLTELTVLKLNQCKLTGEIPEEVFSLTKLTDLYFQSNDLTGKFSDSYTQLVNLKNLYINNNLKLEGSLPASIGQMTKLESINIAQTEFSGTIPQELAQCTSLKNVMAWKNKLSGEIPDFWDKLPEIGVIQFYGNPDITGPIPPTMGTLKKATGIQLKECNLTGNIPASFGGLEKCGNLQLNGNKLEGVVPAEVQAHPKWQATAGWKYDVNILPQQEGYVLLLEPNYRQIDSLTLVKIYNIADGANWKESRRWKLDEPMDTWPGIKLNDKGRVIEMSITNGTVTTVEWEIPEALADLAELSTLQIVGSKLKGQIPAFLYDMTKLTVIRLNSNDLTGELSDKISQWTELTELYLNLNKNFGGTIPQTIGQLKKLVSINIAQTAIGGEIPQTLAQCSDLKNFMAWNNNLSGQIPDFWDQLPNIGVLQLYGNPGITGPIPASIGSLKLATGIQLKECNLTGNIPASFSGLEKCINLQLNGNKLSGVVPKEVQAHPKWQATTGWKYETNILPQQEGYGLTLK